MGDEYIRRSDALKGVELFQCGWAEIEAVQTDYIERLPAVDVAPVVRCEDCQNWKRNVGLTDSPNGHCFEHDIDTNGRDFCSYGERMRRRSGEADSREPETADDTEL